MAIQFRVRLVTTSPQVHAHGKEWGVRQRPEPMSMKVMTTNQKILSDRLKYYVRLHYLGPGSFLFQFRAIWQ
jgi:hypothetical protein